MLPLGLWMVLVKFSDLLPPGPMLFSISAGFSSLFLPKFLQSSRIFKEMISRYFLIWTQAKLVVTLLEPLKVQL